AVGMKHQGSPAGSECRCRDQARSIDIEHVDGCPARDGRNDLHLAWKLRDESEHVRGAFLHRCKRTAGNRRDALANRRELFCDWASRESGMQRPASSRTTERHLDQPMLGAPELAVLIDE